MIVFFWQSLFIKLNDVGMTNAGHWCQGPESHTVLERFIAAALV